MREGPKMMHGGNKEEFGAGWRCEGIFTQHTGFRHYVPHQCGVPCFERVPRELRPAVSTFQWTTMNYANLGVTSNSVVLLPEAHLLTIQLIALHDWAANAPSTRFLFLQPIHEHRLVHTQPTTIRYFQPPALVEKICTAATFDFDPQQHH